MITEEHTKKVVAQIKEWGKIEDKIVIGIDGYSGAGKTTLLKNIGKEMNNVIIAHRDDFNKQGEEFKKIFTDAKDKERALEYELLDIDKLRLFITKYRNFSNTVSYCLVDNELNKRDVRKKFDFSKPVLIIEGVFLFHPKQLNNIFDKRIFLETDMEAADNRRRKREIEKWGEGYYPDTEPDSYFRLISSAYKKYLKRDKPKERADLVLKV